MKKVVILSVIPVEINIGLVVVIPLIGVINVPVVRITVKDIFVGMVKDKI